jgi:hypothetical protein
MLYTNSENNILTQVRIGAFLLARKERLKYPGFVRLRPNAYMLFVGCIITYSLRALSVFEAFQTQLLL